MKKILLSFLAALLLTSVSFANCSQNCEKTIKTPGCGCESTCDEAQKTNSCENPLNKKKTCEKCTIEDDEYCVYNQCFFDKQFRKMKKALCLTAQQESCIDNIYRNFKADMENTHFKYRTQKNKLLDMIECDRECQKEQISLLKEMRKDAKEKCKEFRSDIKEQLCKNQYSDFRKFQRAEKKKMKKLVKYGAIYKFPCVDCCN